MQAKRKVSVEAVYITSELDRRRPKKIDHLSEKRAIQDLATMMIDRPDDVLPRFVDLALQLTGGTSAGISVFEPEPAPGQFRWRYLKGKLARFEDARTPRNFSPCGVTLDENRPVLSRHPERVYDWISSANIVVPEVLLVPLQIGLGEPLGTLWIVAQKEGQLDSGHARAMTELAGFVSIALRMQRTEQRLHHALEQQETLTQEMSHRLKNVFALSNALLRVSARSATSKEELVDAYSGRLRALAGAHALVRNSLSTIVDATREADLATLIATIIAPHDFEAGHSRFEVAGPSIQCADSAVNSVALVFHELATNAAKYGALRSEAGTVAISWTRVGDAVSFTWTERGGPDASMPPSVSGFGARLLGDTIEREFRGALTREWRREGLMLTFVVPADALED